MTSTLTTSSSTSGTSEVRTASVPDFYRYPTKRLVAVLDGPTVGPTLDALTAAGVDPREIQVMSGDDGRRRLDRDGTRHGLVVRLQRGLTAALTSDAQNPLALLDTALTHGAVLLAVPIHPAGVPRDLDVEALLSRHGARHVLRFNRWSITSRQH